MATHSSTTGFTFNLQGFSTEDGPGIRTTVFFKGCPLSCAWCHNPEGMRPQAEIMWYDVRCIAARDCLAACPVGALQLTPQGMAIDRDRCTLCSACAQACPSAALEIIGQPWTAPALLDELLKDQAFYEASGGGVTFSGGEPMLQGAFLAELLPLCKQAGLHVALDTCGAVAWQHYQPLLQWIDLVLLDLKVMDPQRHRQAAGADNHIILENARRFSAAGMPLWIRTPVIPGFTQDLDNICAIARFIQQELSSVERWDLLAYTNLGRPKYHRLDRPYALENIPLLTRQEMETAWQAAVAIFPGARWSGATRQSSTGET